MRIKHSQHLLEKKRFKTFNHMKGKINP